MREALVTMGNVWLTRSLYPRDWDHFLERMGPRLSGIERHAVSGIY